MIRKLVRQMLTAQIVSALTVSLCLLIDSIMISRFLGENAMAAYSLANPVLLAIGAIGTLLSAGIQVACGKSLGRGSQEETDAGYSSAIVLAAGISVVFAVAVVLLRKPLATVMGAGREGELFENTRDYLAGFSIGAPGSMGALVLVPFLQMAGQSNLLIVAVLGMTVADVALDLLSVFVFNGGMFGMGLASALSYYTAILIGIFYFLSKKSAFRFSRKLVSRRKIAELFRGGIPAGFNMASSVLLVFVMNRILKAAGGENAVAAVAAYAVITSIANAANCISTGTGGVSLTLAGVLYNEEDRTGLGELMRQLFRSAVLLGLGMGVVLLVFAPAVVSLFVQDIPDNAAERNMAVMGLRLFAAGLIPCCLNNALKYLYQATGREKLTEAYSMAEGFLFPALAALLFSLLPDAVNVWIWLWFAAGELLALLAAAVMIRVAGRKRPDLQGGYMLLRKGFGAGEGHLLERQLKDLDEVAEFTREAEQFCLRHGYSARMANRIALCIEETAGNTIQHGFSDRKPHHLSVRVLHKKDGWTLRFRDDCKAFDPVHYIPAGKGDALGIRLVQKLSTEAYYTHSLNLNNLTLKLPEEPQEEPGGE